MFFTFIVPLEKLSCCHRSVKVCSKVYFTCARRQTNNNSQSRSYYCFWIYHSNPCPTPSSDWYMLLWHKWKQKGNEAKENLWIWIFYPAPGTLASVKCSDMEMNGKTIYAIKLLWNFFSFKSILDRKVQIFNHSFPPQQIFIQPILYTRLSQLENLGHAAEFGWLTMLLRPS